MRFWFSQIVVSIALMLMFVSNVIACTTCGCTVGMLGKNSLLNDQEENQRWYFRYIYDQVVWRDKPAAEIHELHHDDHDVHNKTTEITHHYQIGRHISDDLNVLLDIPYALRNSTEIDEHANLGIGQHARGLGDLQLLAEYRIWHNEQHSLGLAGGFKFPTGSTREKNFQGERFETEFQPGSGAYNYILGGFYKWENGPLSVTGNSSYVITQKGAQDFEFGDLYTASLEAGYSINPKSRYFKTKVGINSIFQLESKEQSLGIKNPDSGGQTVLLGPTFKIDANERINFTGSLLFPVSQRLNGLTQKQDFNWIMSTQVRF